ncbi:MAG: sigma-70 family RNA polymerase sigma factor [Bacteroidales bacterium]|nr:sigma-70 family RNA polymerase sigma factor [Bacteroidales bacterium]
MTDKEYNEGVDAWSDDAYRFALRCSGDRETSLDAVQEAFATLWERRGKVEAAKGKNYLLGTIYHQLMDDFRRHRIMQKNEEGIKLIKETYARPDENFDLREALQRAMRQLPQVQRALLELRDVEDMSYDEMATTLGLSMQQVQVYLFRARVTMKKLLTSYGYGK